MSNCLFTFRWYQVWNYFRIHSRQITVLFCDCDSSVAFVFEVKFFNQLSLNRKDVYPKLKTIPFSVRGINSMDYLFSGKLLHVGGGENLP